MTFFCTLFYFVVAIGGQRALYFPELSEEEAEQIPVAMRRELRERVEQDDVQTVVHLIRDLGLNPNTPDDTCALRTPLHNAPTRKMIRILLLLGAAIDARDANGQTALHVAATHFENELVNELIDRGASVSILDNNGHSAHCFTTEFCPTKTRKRLITRHCCPDFPAPEPLDYRHLANEILSLRSMPMLYPFIQSDEEF